MTMRWRGLVFGRLKRLRSDVRVLEVHISTFVFRYKSANISKGTSSCACMCPCECVCVCVCVCECVGERERERKGFRSVWKQLILDNVSKDESMF